MQDRDIGSEQRVDAWITGDEDLLADPFAAEVVSGVLCGGKVERGEPGDEASVGLFGEGLEKRWGAQPGLDVGDGDLAVEARERSGKRRGGVPLHDTQRGGERVEVLVDASDHAREQQVEVLALLHDLILELEEREGEALEGRERDEVWVLSCEEQVWGTGRIMSERAPDSLHLDAFGACAEDEEDRGGSGGGGR